MTETPMTERNAVLGGTLYLVATPIGNMADLSERAVKVLSECDFIAAEDTRVTHKLLARLELRREIVSYHEHNKHERGTQLLERLLRGESCALVTDAGMPAISDPGEDLVALCAREKVPVVCIPGACAAVTALAVSGLPTGKFAFEGFLPVKAKERNARLRQLASDERTLIFYEAPHRLGTTLSDLFSAFGNRRIALCRELTKLNEEVIRTTLECAQTLYTEQPPKGEFVLVVDGFAETKSASPSREQVAEQLAERIASGMTASEAVKATARETGLGKNVVYDIYLAGKE